MPTVQQKQQYLQQVQSVVTALAELQVRAEVLAQMFVDREYDAAAADPITPTDLEGFGVGQYQMGVAINLFQAFGALMTGQASNANGAIPPAVNKWRTI